MQSERIERLAEYLCSEFDFSLNPCVGYSWPEHENDDGYRGDGSFVKLQPSDVQAYARENAKRILAFLEREAALSAAEPQPAPSVAVKALEWSDEDNGDFIAQSIVGWYHIGLPHLTWNLMTPNGDVPSFNTLKEAKAAAQADYEARVSSALSAQVQDVAGWQPIDTAPKDGTQILAFEIGGYFNCWWHDNGYGEQYWMDEADSEPNPTHWMPLPAAPAKQEG